MYKDKEKQREANRERQRRHRLKGVTQGRPILKEGVTESGCDKQGVTVSQESMVIPKDRGKRGKDIKCFEDLPPDVQATINRLSESNEEKAKRTQAAIKYQHLFPDRFHSTGA